MQICTFNICPDFSYLYYTKPSITCTNFPTCLLFCHLPVIWNYSLQFPGRYNYLGFQCIYISGSFSLLHHAMYLTLTALLWILRQAAILLAHKSHICIHSGLQITYMNIPQEFLEYLFHQYINIYPSLTPDYLFSIRLFIRYLSDYIRYFIHFMYAFWLPSFWPHTYCIFCHPYLLPQSFS